MGNQDSMSVFGNKWHLLEAEYAFSTREYDQALEKYTSAIDISKDHGLLHEMALGYELIGNYYKTQCNEEESKKCYEKSRDLYKSWGAYAVVAKKFSSYEKSKPYQGNHRWGMDSRIPAIAMLKDR